MGRLTLVGLATLVFTVGAAGQALAVHPDEGSGCGLGKMLWADYSHQKAIGPQVLQATTNGTSGNQTFGISTGTSGCTNDGTIFASEKAKVFASANFDNLAQEMAQGQGEHLSSLATLMGIPAEQHQVFFSMTQEKYTTLVQGGESSPKAVIKALHDAMNGHPVLAQAAISK